MIRITLQSLHSLSKVSITVKAVCTAIACLSTIVKCILHSPLSLCCLHYVWTTSLHQLHYDFLSFLTHSGDDGPPCSWGYPPVFPFWCPSYTSCGMVQFLARYGCIITGWSYTWLLQYSRSNTFVMLGFHWSFAFDFSPDYDIAAWKIVSSGKEEKVEDKEEMMRKEVGKVPLLWHDSHCVCLYCCMCLWRVDQYGICSWIDYTLPTKNFVYGTMQENITLLYACAKTRVRKCCYVAPPTNTSATPHTILVFTAYNHAGTF